MYVNNYFSKCYVNNKTQREKLAKNFYTYIIIFQFIFHRNIHLILSLFYFTNGFINNEECLNSYLPNGFPFLHKDKPYYLYILFLCMLFL